MITKYKVWVQ